MRTNGSRGLRTKIKPSLISYKNMLLLCENSTALKCAKTDSSASWRKNTIRNSPHQDLQDDSDVYKNAYFRLGSLPPLRGHSVSSLPFGICCRDALRGCLGQWSDYLGKSKPDCSIPPLELTITNRNRMKTC